MAERGLHQVVLFWPSSVAGSIDPKAQARRSAAVKNKQMPLPSPYVFLLHISAHPTSTSGLARIFFLLSGGSKIAIFFRGETCRDCLGNIGRQQLKRQKRKFLAVFASLNLKQRYHHGWSTEGEQKNRGPNFYIFHSSFFLPILWLDWGVIARSRDKKIKRHWMHFKIMFWSSCCGGGICVQNGEGGRIKASSH